MVAPIEGAGDSELRSRALRITAGAGTISTFSRNGTFSKIIGQ